MSSCSPSAKTPAEGPIIDERPTLVGVASGTPDGGVAVIRLSGALARAIAARLTGHDDPAPRRVVRRAVRLLDGTADDGLLVSMPGPRSFTGEDVVELHVHAGHRNVRAVVEACLEAGAVAAGPGDFTRRAFEAGKLTLDQAEGIAALIGAQTDEALAQARRLVAGDLGREVDALRGQLEQLRVEIEANLDFPEDVEVAHTQRWAAELEDLLAAVQRWLAGFEAGRRARERARIVIAGPTNAGKSSLFNALLGRSRAIVADMPGTTRDYVEADVNFGPHGAWLVDTAGLRAGAEAIEAEGIARSRDQLEQADVVLWVEATDAVPQAEGPPTARAGQRVILVASKCELGSARPGWLPISTTQQRGLDALAEAIRAWFREDHGSAWIGLARHRDRAREALEQLERARELLARDGALEAIAFELTAAQMRLGAITGHTQLGPVGEELLHQIFSRFCIGK